VITTRTRLRRRRRSSVSRASGVCRRGIRVLQYRSGAYRAVLTERTKAILPVHIAGLPAELDRVHEIAKHRGIPVIEDAAHAFPSRYRGKMVAPSAM